MARVSSRSGQDCPRSRATVLLVLAWLLLLVPVAFAETGSGESPDFLLKLFGTFDPATVVGDPAPGIGAGESRELVIDLRGITGPSELLRSAESPVFAVNLLGLHGGLSVRGTVFEGDTGKTISGASVTIGGKSATTDGAGAFTVSGLSVGERTLTVTKEGYASGSERLLLTAGHSLRRDFTLYLGAASGSLPRVLRISSGFSGFLYFLDSTVFPRTFTAEVDWAGHPPGEVQFITPKGSFSVPTRTPTASRDFDMGSDFGYGGRLGVVAVSADGARSTERLADFAVVKPLPGFVFGSTTILGDSFYYRTKLGPNWNLLNVWLPDDTIPKSIPLFGGHGFGLRFVPTVWAEVKGDQGFVRLLEEGGVLPSFSLLGQEVHVNPFIEADATYNLQLEDWQWWGSAGVSLQSVIQAPPVYLPNPLLLPLFFKFSFEPRLDLKGTIRDLDPFEWELNGKLVPYGRGALAAGLIGFSHVEGWIGAGAEIEFQVPQAPLLRDFVLFVNAGVSVYAWCFKWENALMRWDWDLYDSGTAGVRLASLEPPPIFQPVGREYLQAGNYGRFSSRSAVTLQGPLRQPPLTSSATPIQTKVFPYSEPMAASSGMNFGLIWLYDQPQRTQKNRTLAVFSQYDGNAWTEPVAVADDGTADFHPQLLAFGDGSAVAAWEDEGAVLPDTGTFDDMKANLEISAAFFDPQARQWLPAQRFTTNNFLDRSPAIAGRSKDHLLLTWVANPANDTAGNSTNVNELWYSRWNGQVWSAPARIASVPNPLLKYSLAYDGTNACLVASLDTDGDLQTIGDHELVRWLYQGGAWGAGAPLTSDAVVDDNPQLALDPQGNFVMIWLRTNEVSSVVNFDFAQRQVVREEPDYSSNLADFRLAANPDGRLALVWAEPSEFSSDLRAIFYDPVFRLWGHPKQLTADAETERGTTTAFFGTDTLVAVYNRTQLGQTNLAQRLASGRVVQLAAPKPGGTDLYVLQYRLGDDLALKADALEATPANPMPGITAELQTTVVNLGDRPVEDVPVVFYLGHPAQGGAEIARTNLTEPLVPGASVNLTVLWTVPPADAPLAVYAVVDPNLSLTDANRLNNVVTADFVKADLAVESITWARITENRLSVTARVANQGSLTNAAATLRWRQGINTVLATNAVPALAPGESIDLNFLLDVTGLQQDRELVATLEGVNAAGDFDADNNAARLTIQKVSESTAPQLAATELLANGVFRFTVTGQVGRHYTIQASTNLFDWLDLTNFVAPTPTPPVMDLDASGHSQRFYRGRTP